MFVDRPQWLEARTSHVCWHAADDGHKLLGTRPTRFWQTQTALTAAVSGLKMPHHGPLDSLFDVDVLKDDHGGLAAQLLRRRQG